MTDAAARQTPAEWADGIVGNALRAAEAFLAFDQARTDRVVRAVYEAAWAARFDLARLAHDETGMGVYEHKVLKNAWAAHATWADIAGRRSAGVIAEDAARGLVEIARPKGPVVATLPVTNPTSTTIFKALLCMKARNPVIFSPHRGARKSIKEAVRVVAEAAAAAGAPEHAIQIVTKSQAEYTQAVLAHPGVALIVATGTPSIVRTAQLSGTPTLGAGPGNVPVYVHASADLEHAARDIVHSKTFDGGVICASEQALVVTRAVYPKLREHLEARGAYFCTHAQMEALGPKCYDAERDGMRADVVGQPAAVIARRAGIPIPDGTRLLIAEPAGIGPGHPLSYEILAPVLACYPVDDHAAALRTCTMVLAHGGRGHTLGLHTTDEASIADAAALDAARILINQPCTEGALGGTTSALHPSLTLSTGAGGRNLDTDNLTLAHLLNTHRLARFAPSPTWSPATRSAWLSPGTPPPDA